ncbi:MAG: hypothetical protein GW917_03125, partial [Bdellovibrionales bacterium]|nr:hypothetical protein [Bdellovibrionales bacterium]
MFKKLLYVFALCTPFAATQAANLGLSPSALKLKVYKFAVSTNPLCTNLVTVVDNGSTPLEVDFSGSVNLGSGSLADGTYPCVVIEMSDKIKYTSASTSTAGNCVSGTEYTLDVCSSGTSTLVDGTTVTCSAADNKVALHISTAST